MPVVEDGEGGANTGEGAEDSGTGGGASGSGDATGSPTSGSSSSPGDPTGAPPTGDRPPADDDDIIARQLREAAERETDPVLKEKLWQEYDKYKGSS